MSVTLQSSPGQAPVSRRAGKTVTNLEAVDANGVSTWNGSFPIVLADGLVVGTGNSIGRLDIRLGEVMTMADIHVSVQRKDGAGPVLLLRPDWKYLERIRRQPDDQPEALSIGCSRLPENKLFTIEQLPASDTGKKPEQH